MGKKTGGGAQQGQAAGGPRDAERQRSSEATEGKSGERGERAGESETGTNRGPARKDASGRQEGGKARRGDWHAVVRRERRRGIRSQREERAERQSEKKEGGRERERQRERERARKRR
jgi:hypothetical protein